MVNCSEILQWVYVLGPLQPLPTVTVPVLRNKWTNSLWHWNKPNIFSSRHSKVFLIIDHNPNSLKVHVKKSCFTKVKSWWLANLLNWTPPQKFFKSLV